MLAILRIQLIGIYRIEVFEFNLCPADERQMILEHITGSRYCHRNYRYAGFGSDLETSLMERKHGTLVMISCSLGEYGYGVPFLHQIYTIEDALKSLPHILAVQELAVHECHPYAHAGDFASLFFSQICSRTYDM